MGLFSFGSTKKSSSLKWVNFTDSSQLAELMSESAQQPVLFFKHSIRCSISAMAKSRLEKNWDIENMATVYLDLINFRSLSILLADKFNVQHQSPQVLLIKDGECVYNASHSEISVDEIKNNL